MSDTPRTDAEDGYGWPEDAYCVPTEFARRLERELTACRSRVRELIAERDTARMNAEQKWDLRRDISEELGGEDPEAALIKIRELKARVRELDRLAEIHDLNADKPKYPADGDTVLCCYVGVYGWRVVQFWRDPGLNPHFGYPASEPATHWMALPNEPEGLR